MENEIRQNISMVVLEPSELSVRDIFIRDLVRNNIPSYEIRYFTRTNDQELAQTVSKLQALGELPNPNKVKNCTQNSTRTVLKEIVTENPEEYFTLKKLRDELSDKNISVSGERIRKILLDFKDEGVKFKTLKDKKIDKEALIEEKRAVKKAIRQKIDGLVKQSKHDGLTDKKIEEKYHYLYKKVNLETSLKRLRKHHDIPKLRIVRSAEEVEKFDSEVRSLCEAGIPISEICTITNSDHDLIYSTIKRLKNKFHWDRKDFVTNV